MTLELNGLLAITLLTASVAKIILSILRGMNSTISFDTAVEVVGVPAVPVLG